MALQILVQDRNFKDPNSLQNKLTLSQRKVELKGSQANAG